MSELAAWVLAFVASSFVHWDRVSPGRRAELERLSVTIADASEVRQLRGRSSVDTASWLVTTAKLETGFVKTRAGQAGELGYWQLMPPPRGAPVPASDEAQALEAIRRWNDQGPNGYTGETGHCEFGICPLALNRELGGALYLSGHPFPPTSSAGAENRERFAEACAGRGLVGPIW